MATTRIPYKWNDANFAFSSNPYTWDDVALVRQLVEAIGVGEDPMAYLAKEPEKKKKVIKLICKVQGIEYKEEKEIQDYKITVKDIEILAEEVLGINVTIL